MRVAMQKKSASIGMLDDSIAQLPPGCIDRGGSEIDYLGRGGCTDGVAWRNSGLC